MIKRLDIDLENLNLYEMKELLKLALKQIKVEMDDKDIPRQLLRHFK